MSRKFNRNMLSVCVEAALIREQQDRHQAAIDAANPARVAQAQLAAEGHPLDAATFDAAAAGLSES